MAQTNKKPSVVLINLTNRQKAADRSKNVSCPRLAPSLTSVRLHLPTVDKMPLIQRIRRTIGKRWYAILPTDRLIAMVGDQGGARNADILIEAVKERLAHQDGSLDYLDWSSANLNGALLSSCRMKHANFSSALLRGAYFGYSDMSAADFSFADLRESHFREATLTDSTFEGTNLQDANFARAVLVGSSFVAADLTNVNFWRADLRGANLTDALLKNCIMVDVVVDDRTTLPNGETCTDRVFWDRFTSGRAASRD